MRELKKKDPTDRFATARAKIGSDNRKALVSISEKSGRPKVQMGLEAYEAIANELEQLRAQLAEPGRIMLCMDQEDRAQILNEGYALAMAHRLAPDERLDDAEDWLQERLAAAKGPVRGYLIVDKVTGALDWDGELHPSHQAAVHSMCGPYQPYVKTQEEAGQDRTCWADVYDICEVLEAAE